MAAATTVYLIRHAITDWVGRAIAGWAPGVHLNATGQQQAEALAQALATARIDRIYTSPLERARETAGPLSKRIGVDPEMSEAIGELQFGDWTGKTLNELAGDSRWNHWNSFRSNARIPDGESMLEAQTRFVRFLQQLPAQFPGKTVAAFSHADPIRAALLYHLGMPLDFVHRLEISPASISILRLSSEGSQILCVNRLGSAEQFEPGV